jgi:hypothetical protein
LEQTSVVSEAGPLDMQLKLALLDVEDPAVTMRLCDDSASDTELLPSGGEFLGTIEVVRDYVVPGGGTVADAETIRLTFR